MDDRQNITFQKLTPIDNADISVYEDAIEFSLKNDDIIKTQQLHELIDRDNADEIFMIKGSNVINGVEWFTKTIDVNIQSNLDANSKARARSWRLLKLEEAIAHREAGKYPISSDILDKTIDELKEILSAEK